MDGNDKLVIAKPKSDKLPYTQVEFRVSPQMEITSLIVSGRDDAVLIFKFSNERRDPVIDEKMFKLSYRPEPPGWKQRRRGRNRSWPISS